MDTVADYEKWEAAQPKSHILAEWLHNPDVPVTISQEQRVMAWTILIAAIIMACGAAYLLFRYRSHIRRAVKSSIATTLIAAIRARRYLRAEATDIRAQVSRGLDSDRR